MEQRKLVLNPSDRVERRGLMRALDEAQCLIWMSPDGDVLDANENAVDLFGYSGAGFRERSFFNLICGRRAPMAADLRIWASICAGELRHEERSLFRFDAEEVWTSASYAVMRNPNGAPRRILMLVINLSSWAWKPKDAARPRGI
jgi:PAS domain S-box-containing protein